MGYAHAQHLLQSSHQEPTHLLEEPIHHHPDELQPHLSPEQDHPPATAQRHGLRFVVPMDKHMTMTVCADAVVCRKPVIQRAHVVNPRHQSVKTLALGSIVHVAQRMALPMTTIVCCVAVVKLNHVTACARAQLPHALWCVKIIAHQRIAQCVLLTEILMATIVGDVAVVNLRLVTKLVPVPPQPHQNVRTCVQEAIS